VNTGRPQPVETPFGTLQLQRYPSPAGDRKQAWNAADLLLLEAARAEAVPPTETLVVNDEFGALCTALGNTVTVWSDSHLSHRAIAINAALNGLAPPPSIIQADQSPLGDFRLVLLRIPKNLALLGYQLERLRTVLPPDTLFLCAGMDKHLPRTVAAVLEAGIGPLQRHPGQRKARLFSGRLSAGGAVIREAKQRFFCPELDCEIDSRPGVFSGERLDIGTRLLLEQMAGMPDCEQVVDLGCGNGVIGLAALRQNARAKVSFIDESCMAVASARANVERLYPERASSCRFLLADGLLDYAAEKPELVLCNPPFHQQHAVDDFVGRRLIRQTAAALLPGGELWLVANRHLPYEAGLRRRFGAVERLAENRKFIVWRARARM